MLAFDLISSQISRSIMTKLISSYLLNAYQSNIIIIGSNTSYPSSDHVVHTLYLWL
jgi:hypothetical protein